MSLIRTKKREQLSLANDNIIAFGNSLVYGQGASTVGAAGWVPMMKLYPPLLGTGIVPINLGQPGQRISIPNGGFPAMYNSYVTALNSLVGGKRNTVFFWEMTNEFGANNYDGVRAAEAMKTVMRMFREGAAAKSSGPGVFGYDLNLVLVSGTPFAGGTDSATNIIWQAKKLYNAELRRSWPAYADDFIDLDEMGDFKVINDLARANGDVATRAMLTASPAFIKSDGTAVDYVHYGDPTYDWIAQVMCQGPLRKMSAI